MSIQLNKSKWASIAQAMMTLLWLPGILLINSCQGVIGVVPNDNALIKDGKQEAVNILAPSEVIVFCGNPGVGKSSLCNSIFQKNVFKSGVSIGKGMTQEKQEYIYENRKYIDTPGLSDVNLRKQAAEEIEKALKENNNYKIIFVATLEAGRIKPDDLVTINTVCEAIKTPFEYGIIFNKVTNPVIEEIGETGLESYLSTLNKQPSSIVIIKKDGDMEDAKNIHLSVNSENRKKLLDFIFSLKANMILVNNVQHIDVEAYQKKVQEMELKLNEALERAEEERKKAEEERKRHEKEIADLADKAKKQDLILQNQTGQINTLGTQLQQSQQAQQAQTQQITSLTQSLSTVSSQLQQTQQSQTQQITNLNNNLNNLQQQNSTLQAKMEEYQTPPSVTASNYIQPYVPAGVISGGRWNAGAFAPQWFEVDLKKEKNISRIELFVAQEPNGYTRHIVTGGPSPNPINVLCVFEGQTYSSQRLAQSFRTALIRYIRVTTTQSPSYVAWDNLTLS